MPASNTARITNPDRFLVSYGNPNDENRFFEILIFAMTIQEAVLFFNDEIHKNTKNYFGIIHSGYMKFTLNSDKKEMSGFTIRNSSNGEMHALYAYMPEIFYDPRVPTGNKPYIIDLEMKTIIHPGSDDVDALHATYADTPNNPGDITIRRHRLEPTMKHAAEVAKATYVKDDEIDSARVRDVLAFWNEQQ